jgi:hypothetical protein
MMPGIPAMREGFDGQQSDGQNREDEPENKDESLLVHVTTTVEHIQLILETVSSIIRLEDESVLVLTRDDSIIHYPDFDGPLLIADDGTLMGDSCFSLYWTDGRSAAEIFQLIAEHGKLGEHELAMFSLESEYNNPTRHQNIEFCAIPPSDN